MTSQYQVKVSQARFSIGQLLLVLWRSRRMWYWGLIVCMIQRLLRCLRKHANICWMKTGWL